MVTGRVRLDQIGALAILLFLAGCPSPHGDPGPPVKVPPPVQPEEGAPARAEEGSQPPPPSEETPVAAEGVPHRGEAEVLPEPTFGQGVAKVDPGEREDERLAMVRRQLAGRDIRDRLVLEAMGRVLRHRLIPERVRRSAYVDSPLPIGHGQTISQPYMVALMTEKLALQGGEKVLEIGTGSGYQAAVLAEICKEVYTVEIVKPLAESAARALPSLGYENIHTRTGDGYFGWKEHAPYDGIIITAAASHIPPPLLEQLKEGGRLVVPLGNPLLYQTITIVEKRGGRLSTTRSTTCTFVPMTGSIESK